MSCTENFVGKEVAGMFESSYGLMFPFKGKVIRQIPQKDVYKVQYDVDKKTVGYKLEEIKKMIKNHDDLILKKSDDNRKRGIPL
jgi:hypothetical protein